MAARACATRGVSIIKALVGINDRADELVAHDVGAGQVAELDVVDVAEDVFDDGQARSLAAGQVNLRGVARDDDLGAETQAGEEHLHLADRRVLGLVQDDEGVVEGCVRACTPGARPRSCRRP